MPAVRECASPVLGTVERKRCTYDVSLTSLFGVCPISAFGPRQINVICTVVINILRSCH